MKKKKKKYTEDPNYRYTLEPIPLAIMTVIATGIWYLLYLFLDWVAVNIVKYTGGIAFLICGAIILFLLRKFREE